MRAEKFIKNFLSEAGIQLNGSRPYDVRICNPKIFQKWMLDPSIIVGEAYMDGWWECDKLDELFFKLFVHYFNKNYFNRWVAALYFLRNSFVNLQTKMRSKKVAEIHYNLGNDLYKAMLGPTMAYTCGYWKNAHTLDKAQNDKYDLICRKLYLQPGENLLELGCGWGGFAKYAAENYGCRVVGVNISTEQVRFAKEICAHLPVEICLSDYRDINAYNPQKIKFDKVASIGLCEHVGFKNYHKFMKIARENLKDDGLFLLHTIGKNETVHYVDPWIDKYIFPGGILPSTAQLAGAMEGVFVLEDQHNFGADYDKTLMAWHQNFIKSWPDLKDRYDERFYRMWNYYLLSCAGGFRARNMQLWQFVLSPKGVLGGYESVR